LTWLRGRSWRRLQEQSSDTRPATGVLCIHTTLGLPGSSRGTSVWPLKHGQTSLARRVRSGLMCRDRVIETTMNAVLCRLSAPRGRLVRRAASASMVSTHVCVTESDRPGGAIRAPPRQRFQSKPPELLAMQSGQVCNGLLRGAASPVRYLPGDLSASRPFPFRLVAHLRLSSLGFPQS
jgi:hypothetical protein